MLEKKSEENKKENKKLSQVWRRGNWNRVLTRKQEQENKNNKGDQLLFLVRKGGERS